MICLLEWQIGSRRKRRTSHNEKFYYKRYFTAVVTWNNYLAVDELELGERVIEIAFDTNPICVELLQKGTVSALIVQNPYAMGYLGVEKAWQSLQGQRFDANTLINTTTTTITRDTMFTIESQKAIFSFD